ncbi:hypothetical protein [Sorangium sp. So ce124]
MSCRRCGNDLHLPPGGRDRLREILAPVVMRHDFAGWVVQA